MKHNAGETGRLLTANMYPNGMALKYVCADNKNNS